MVLSVFIISAIFIYLLSGLWEHDSAAQIWLLGVVWSLLIKSIVPLQVRDTSLATCLVSPAAGFSYTVI